MLQDPPHVLVAELLVELEAEVGGLGVDVAVELPGRDLVEALLVVADRLLRFLSLGDELAEDPARHHEALGVELLNDAELVRKRLSRHVGLGDHPHQRLGNEGKRC